MKKLTAKQLDAKFAKAAKLAKQLNDTVDEIYLGCETFRYGYGNSISIINKADYLASTFEYEREMHRADKK